MVQNIAVTTTLKDFKANVRMLAKALSEQESKLLNKQLVDMVHYGIVFVRTLVGKFIDDHYRVLNTGLVVSGGAKPNYTVSITALDITDVNKVTLYSSGLGPIPVYSHDVFNSIRELYSAADMGIDRAVATIYLNSLTPAVLTLALYTNSTSAPTIEMVYIRNPIKVTAGADTVDLPEHLVPIAIDFVAANAHQLLGRQVPTALEQRLIQFINKESQQHGLRVSPRTTE